MSRYEGQNGKGAATQADLRKLRHELMEKYNAQLVKYPQPRGKKIKRATSRTTSFPFLYPYDGDLISSGSVTINVKEGRFHYEVEENNHALEYVQRSTVYQALSRFIASMPEKGKTYGAETYEWSEYDEDADGHKRPGRTTFYGGWRTLYQPHLTRRRAN